MFSGGLAGGLAGVSFGVEYGAEEKLLDCVLSAISVCVNNIPFIGAELDIIL